MVRKATLDRSLRPDETAAADEARRYFAQRSRLPFDPLARASDAGT